MVVALWSFAEAIVLPVVPDVALDLLGLAAPRRTPALFLVSIVASMFGTAVLLVFATGSLAAAEALVLAVPGINQPMLDAARATVTAGDPASLALFGPGTPLKVYTIGWAAGPATIFGLLIAVVLNRLTRIGPVLLAAIGLGALAPAWLRRHERLVLGVYVGAWLALYMAYLSGAV